MKINGVQNNIGYLLLDCIDKKLKHYTKYLLINLSHGFCHGHGKLLSL